MASQENRPARLAAGRALRVRRQGEISAIFDAGRRAGDATMTLLARRRAQGPDSPPRLAVAVSSRHGKAVRRNRIKRLCREAFRLIRPELPAGWDYVIVPRVGAELTLGRLQDSLKSLAKRATGQGGKP